MTRVAPTQIDRNSGMGEFMGYNSSAAQHGKGHAALADLTRTLEALENRLDRVSRARNTQSPLQSERRDQFPSSAEGRFDAPVRTSPRTNQRRPDLADAVSQIVMRQKVLSQNPRQNPANLSPRRPLPKSPTRHDATSSKGNPSVNDLKSELNRLRAELTRNQALDFGGQVDEMRQALADLQDAVRDNAEPAAVRHEIDRLHGQLDQMNRSGMDTAIVADMRAQLDDIDTYLGSRRTSAPRSNRFASGTGSDNTRDPNRSERAELKADIERLRASIGTLASEDQLRAVEQRWMDFEERFVSEVSPHDRTAELTEKMMAEIASLRDQMQTFSAEHAVRAAETLWHDVEAKFSPRAETGDLLDRIANRIDQLEGSLAALPDALPFETIDRRIESLSKAIEAISTEMRSSDGGEARFSIIDARLDDISEAIVTLANNPAEFDIAPIERIEARMQTLAERVDDIASDGTVSLLAEKLSELSQRLDDAAQNEPNDHIAEQFGRLNARLDELAERNEASSGDMAAIETRLSALAERIEQQMSTPFEDGQAIANLESQVGRLTQFLNSDTFGVSADVERRLDALEKRVEENAEQIFTTAKSAADEAVRQMLEQGDFLQSEHVSKLVEELERLQRLSSDSNVRSADFYEAVNAGLSRLVDRIDAIERDYDVARPQPAMHAESRKANEAKLDLGVTSHQPAGERWTEPTIEPSGETSELDSPTGLRALLSRSFKKRAAKSGSAQGITPFDPADEDRGASMVGDDHDERNPTNEAPPLDAADDMESEEANRPLAIGSGAPDIAALLERVRHQKAGANGDADGASREDNKADFIAAARRAAIAAAEEADGFHETSAEDEREGGLSRRRKPVMLAASAVLLALLALPVGKIIVEKTDLLSNEPVAADMNATQVETVATATDDAVDAPMETDRVTKSAQEKPELGISDEPRREIADSTPPVSTSKAEADAASSAVTNATFSPQSPVRQAGPTIANTRQDYADDVSALPEGLGSEPLLNAAKDGDAKALFEIGLRLMEGRTVSSDPKAAAVWFERAAVQGFAPAQYSLGTLYEKGNGVERDTVAARDWYMQAAEAGNVRAMHNLAVLFATGVDGKSEPELAADWFLKAAQHGMTDSQYNLGILYARGAGVEQSLPESYKWFAIVGQSGDKDALSKRDEVAKSLPPEELARVKQEAANFAPQTRSESANTVDIPESWAAAAAEPTTTASIDMTRAVRNIQVILGKLGYDAGVPDGLVGKQTTAAIREFQKDAGLSATGEIDEDLIRALLDRKDG